MSLLESQIKCGQPTSLVGIAVMTWAQEMLNNWQRQRPGLDIRQGHRGQRGVAEAEPKSAGPGQALWAGCVRGPAAARARQVGQLQ